MGLILSSYMGRTLTVPRARLQDCACNICDAAVCSRPCWHCPKAICALCKALRRPAGCQTVHSKLPSCNIALMLYLYRAPGHLVTALCKYIEGLLSLLT